MRSSASTDRVTREARAVLRQASELAADVRWIHRLETVSEDSLTFAELLLSSYLWLLTARVGKHLLEYAQKHSQPLTAQVENRVAKMESRASEWNRECYKRATYSNTAMNDLTFRVRSLPDERDPELLFDQLADGLTTWLLVKEISEYGGRNVSDNFVALAGSWNDVLCRPDRTDPEWRKLALRLERWRIACGLRREDLAPGWRYFEKVGTMDTSTWASIEESLKAVQIDRETISSIRAFFGLVEEAWPNIPDPPGTIQAGWSVEMDTYPFNVIPGLPGGECQQVLVVLVTSAKDLSRRLDEAAAHVVRCLDSDRRNKVVLFFTDNWDNAQFMRQREIWRALIDTYHVEVFVLVRSGGRFSGPLRPS